MSKKKTKTVVKPKKLPKVDSSKIEKFSSQGKKKGGDERGNG